MLKQEALPDKERLFICPCAKSYFSYAALFTHIKQKHGGKPPGAIIKPKSENKRGRPRKNPVTEASNSDSRQSQKNSDKGSTWVGQLKSSVQLGKTKFDLKSTPGSQFKIYKKNHFSAPTTNQLPQQQNFQFELLKDLSRYLELNTLKEVPCLIFDSIEASKYLNSDEENKETIIDHFKSFLSLCRNGLKPETFSQVFLLLSMFLQHIFQSGQLQQNSSLDSCLIHEHIGSFFEYINRYCLQIDLSSYAIFNDLNTIKTLIVFFNWLSKVENQVGSDEEESNQ